MPITFFICSEIVHKLPFLPIIQQYSNPVNIIWPIIKQLVPLATDFAVEVLRRAVRSAATVISVDFHCPICSRFSSVPRGPSHGTISRLGIVADGRLTRLGWVGARRNVTSDIFSRSPNGLSKGSVRGISLGNFILPLLEGPFFSNSTPHSGTRLQQRTTTISIIATSSIRACCDVSLCPYLSLLSETGAPLQINDGLAVESRVVFKTTVVVCF